MAWLRVVDAVGLAVEELLIVDVSVADLLPGTVSGIFAMRPLADVDSQAKRRER